MSQLQATEPGIAYRPIRQLRRSKGVHKLLYNRLGLPLDASEAAIRYLKKMWNPQQVRARQDLADALPTGCEDAALQREGYLKLEPSYFESLPAALDACNAAFESAERTGALKEMRASGPKEFLVTIIRNEEAFQHKGLMALAVSGPLIRLASKYLGSVPMLSGLRLWWTPANAGVAGSQLYHCDREDRRQIKVLINVTEATRATGPFTMIPADISERIKSAVGYSYKRYRLSDEEVWSAESNPRSVELTGPAGTAYCVDTSRCLHYGSRNNSEQRLLMMIQYTRFLAPNVTVPLWLPPNADIPMELDNIQRLVLGVTVA